MTQSQASGESLQGRPVAGLSLDLVALECSRFKSLRLEVSTRDEQLLSVPDRRKARVAKLLNLGVEIGPGIVRHSRSRRHANGEAGGRKAAPGSSQRESGDGV